VTQQSNKEKSILKKINDVEVMEQDLSFSNRFADFINFNTVKISRTCENIRGNRNFCKKSHVITDKKQHKP
jgi:predicted AAA+ superfamily ATPase